MFCRKCGKEIQADSKFCSGCGTSVGEGFASSSSHSSYSPQGKYETQKYNAMAIIGFAFAAVPFAIPMGTIAIPSAVVAVVLSIIALGQIKATQEKGKVFAILGIIFGIIMLFLSVGFFLLTRFIFSYFGEFYNNALHSIFELLNYFLNRYDMQGNYFVTSLIIKGI